MDIIYGVSVGDYEKGLLRRAFLNGITAEAVDLATFESVMLSATDDRVYDATPAQWTAAHAEFTRGFEFGRTAEI